MSLTALIAGFPRPLIKFGTALEDRRSDKNGLCFLYLQECEVCRKVYVLATAALPHEIQEAEKLCIDCLQDVAQRMMRAGNDPSNHKQWTETVLQARQDYWKLLRREENAQ